MRIMKSKFYVIERRHCDAWGNWYPKKERYIVSGLLAQGRERVNVVEEAHIKPQLRYLLQDGHVLEHCPIVLGNDAKQFLADNPFQTIQEVK